jgi:hypothetical protein
VIIAESLNKITKEDVFHFAAMNFKRNELLFQESFIAKPSGFGLRFYWEGSIYRLIKKIKYECYGVWVSDYI